jgi:hypothetical protein
VQVGRLDDTHAQPVGQAVLRHAPGESEMIDGGPSLAQITVGQVGQNSAELKRKIG